jgi:hypothetical protein
MQNDNFIFPECVLESIQSLNFLYGINDPLFGCMPTTSIYFGQKVVEYNATF